MIDFVLPFFSTPDAVGGVDLALYLNGHVAHLGAVAALLDVGERHIEEVIDLNELLIRNPPATFFLRAAGGSMLKAGIIDGNILVVDRSETTCHGDIVVACLDGEFTVKRLRIGPGCRVWLVPDSDDFKAIEIESERDFTIWGVVTGKVSQFGRFRRACKGH